jgi:hypothetical protein
MLAATRQRCECSDPVTPPRFSIVIQKFCDDEGKGSTRAKKFRLTLVGRSVKGASESKNFVMHAQKILVSTIDVIDDDHEKNFRSVIGSSEIEQVRSKVCHAFARANVFELAMSNSIAK